MNSNQCYICKKQANIQQKGRQFDNDLYSVDCQICGNYLISREASLSLSTDIPNDNIYILSAVTRLASERGLPLRILTNNLKELVDTAPVPDGPLEMVDQILLYVSQKIKRYNELVEFKQNDYPICFARSGDEFIFLCNKACDLGYIKHINNQYRIELKGWQRVTELNKLKPDSRHVFVAMWFDGKTIKLREAIKSGIKASGYIPIIADESDYTGNIMDFVLGSIKQSKFVVADFTCEPEKPHDEENENNLIKGGVRGGVYYEAGFAKGLGLGVIHLCKDDTESKKRLHFDVEQEYTIFWTDKEVENITVRKIEERESNISPRNLSEKLFDRIIRIFGFGPVKMN
jgi:hypothetical protein